MPVLILLAVVWAVVLVPPYMRNRSDSRPSSSAADFRQGLAVLGRAAPGSSLGPHRALIAPPVAGQPVGKAAVRKRRRDVLMALLGASAFTLLLAIALGGPAILLHLTIDAALAGYLYLLVQMRKLASEQATKVRYLAVPAQSQPRLVTIRRTASG